MSLDIITLTETWFQPDTPSNVINSIVPLGYSILNSPRNQGREGSLAFIHRSNFQTSRTKLPTYSSFESLCVKVFLLSASCNVLLVYRPPSSSLSTITDEFSSLLTDLTASPSDLLIS